MSSIASEADVEKMAEGVLANYGVDFVDGRIVCTNPKNVHTFVYESNDDL